MLALAHSSFWPSALDCSLLRKCLLVSWGHGPNLLDNASSGLQDSALFGRLARPGILSRGDCAGEGLFVVTLVLVNLDKSSLHPTQTIDYL